MKKLLIAFLLIIMAVSISPTIIAQEETTNDTYISETAYEACVEYGGEYGICPELLMAIIETESRGQADAESGNCKGLMQISVEWHKDRAERLGVTNIFDERGNILVGTDYLAELFEKYHDAAIALMVYHGEKNAVKKAEDGRISKYAEGILERSAELEIIHGK